MLQLDIQWTQHALGVGHNILEEPTKHIPPSIRDTWTRGVRNFLIDAGCSVLVPSIRPPAPRRERDIAIMDLALQHNMTDVQLRSVQKVRLYLGVTFLSDACNATGNALLPEILARRPITVSQTVELYPHQEAPPHAAWATFIKLLQLQDLDLGNWLPDWTSYRHWNYVYSPSQGYHWYQPNASSDWTCYLNAPSEKRKYLLLDPSNAVTGNKAPRPTPFPSMPPDSLQRLFASRHPREWQHSQPYWCPPT
jgi:hypothetical protein